MDGELSVDELIRAQLQGKSKALERYDEMLWKIRAGYLAVLYALLTVLGGRDFDLASAAGGLSMLEVLFSTALSFSVCALIIDGSFLLAKVRVIKARDALSELALSWARKQDAIDFERLQSLLRLSGEAPGLPRLALIWNAIWPIALMYAITPISLGIILLLA